MQKTKEHTKEYTKEVLIEMRVSLAVLSKYENTTILTNRYKNACLIGEFDCKNEMINIYFY